MDPIADFFNRIANAYRAKKPTVIVPHSKMKEAIASVLKARGYIAGFEKKGRKVRKFLELELRYAGASPVLSSARRISKSSRRVYSGAADIKRVRQGFGLLILSTPKGVMSGEDAKQAHIGGEVIAEVW